MSLIIQNGKIVTRICQVCKKKWEPEQRSTVGFTSIKMHVHTSIGDIDSTFADKKWSREIHWDMGKEENENGR